MVPFESLGTFSYSHSILTVAIFCIISEIQRDIGGKSQIFHTPLAFDAPVRRFTLEYCPKVWYEKKTRIVWLLGGGKSLMMRLAVLTQYWRVTDGRTDGQTDWRTFFGSIVFSMHSIARQKCSMRSVVIIDWTPMRHHRVGMDDMRQLWDNRSVVQPIDVLRVKGQRSRSPVGTAALVCDSWHVDRSETSSDPSEQFDLPDLCSI